MYYSKQLLLSSLMAASLFILQGCGSCSSTTPPPPPVEPIIIDYQTVINDLISAEIPGIVLLVDSPTSQFLGSAGVSNLETQQAMQVSDVMPTASTGKKMIALLAVQLADEGLLNLDDTLDIWLSEDILSRIPNSQQMTMRQLLNHTSGVFNYDEIDDGEAYSNLFLAEPEVLKTDIDFLELIFDHPGYFLPGEGYEYSSSGYSLAALIMDQVLGEHHSVAMRNRFFDPLGMTSTYYKGSEAFMGNFISGYVTTGEGDFIDTKEFLVNTSKADSPVVSSVEDMATFLKALIADDSFANDAVKNIMLGEDNRGEEAFGIGVEIFNGHTIYLHYGRTFGYSAQSIYIEDTDTSIVLFFNCGGDDICEITHDELIFTILQNEL